MISARSLKGLPPRCLGRGAKKASEPLPAIRTRPISVTMAAVFEAQQNKADQDAIEMELSFNSETDSYLKQGS
ncbi:hypothetical protein N9Y42_06445 [Mariniblastus sp.]|nr:hypothetical protein [Mariniblastus sp.]